LAVVIGPAARLLVVIPIGAAFYFRPPTDWRAFAAIFQNITVFSFFMYLGMNWAMKMISGGSGLPFLIPLLIPFFGLAVGELFSLATRGFYAALAAARPFLQNMRPGSSWSVAASYPYLSRLQSQGHALAVVVDHPAARTLLVLSGLGLFFGLSLVMVRLWDQEVKPIRTRETLAPFLVLAPEFAAQLKADEEFFEERIGRLYADGLTRDQVDSVKQWCEARSIEVVPLAPTMSFALWIFLGFFICYVLSGGHVLEAAF
jgi:hypothetical protein